MYNTQHILAYEIPNFSTLSRNTNLSRETPMWNWLGPDRVDEKVQFYLSYTTSEALHNPSYAQEFNLHFICEGRFVQTDDATLIELGPFVATVTISINTDHDPSSESTEPPLPRHKVTRLQNTRKSIGFSCQNGLHMDRGLENGEFEIVVTPLDDLVLESGRGALRVLLSNEELGFDLRRWGVDMDNATGRVIIWGRNGESEIFVGDLV